MRNSRGTGLTSIWRIIICVTSGLLSLVQMASAQTPADSDTEQVRRGEYLARAGNCMGCHTTRGGEPYAGGRKLNTPFGQFVTPNITSDNETGIGSWSGEDFWQALHYGKSKDGRNLYPAFPYTEYTKVTRPDADAIFAYLRSLSPVAQTNLPHKINPPTIIKRSCIFGGSGISMKVFINRTNPKAMSGTGVIIWFKGSDTATPAILRVTYGEQVRTIS